MPTYVGKCPTNVHLLPYLNYTPIGRLRRDREVERLQDYQEIEFVLKQAAPEVRHSANCEQVSQTNLAVGRIDRKD
jgi:hypothetical protein